MHVRILKDCFLEEVLIDIYYVIFKSLILQYSITKVEEFNSI